MTDKTRGRPREMVDGKRHNIYLDEVSWRKAAAIGDGSPSKGIRAALMLCHTDTSVEKEVKNV